MDYSRELAKAALEIKAIKLNPKKPFTWASGYKMPIYNDNRMFLGYPRHRKLISKGFDKLIIERNMEYVKGDHYKALIERRFEIIAGTSTAGISPATTLSDKLFLPLIYVRDMPKDHGLKNQIEGIDSESNLKNKRVLLIEDLISTGGSSAKAVQAIREARGICVNCYAIFDYGLDKANQVFNGQLPYDKQGNKLPFPCKKNSLLNYSVLLDVAKEIGYINKKEEKMLEEWREDPFKWGEKHGHV